MREREEEGGTKQGSMQEGWKIDPHGDDSGKRVRPECRSVRRSMGRNRKATKTGI